MKKETLAFTAIFIAFGLHAQQPKVEWAKSIGGAGNERANSVQTDSKENIILVGRFQSSTIELGGVTLTKNTEDNDDVADIFIIKLEKDGNPLWAIAAGEKGDDHAIGCITDQDDNIYVVGWFESKNLKFGSISLRSKSSKGSDMFVAKFSPSGECLWARNAGGEKSSGDYSSIALDRQNNVIVSGIYDSLMNFEDGIKLTTEKRTMYVAKYNSDGKVLWAKNAVGGGEGQGVGTDEEGNIYVGGLFITSTFIFDEIVIQNTGVKTNDVFVVKYSPNGTAIWAKNFGGKGYDIGSGAADSKGNVYAAGIFFSDTIKADHAQLVNKSESGNVFVVKYDTDGKLRWAKSTGGQKGIGARKFYVAQNGDVFVTGSNYSDFNFGKSSVKNVAGSEDIFVLKYDADGKEKWAMNFGGEGRNAGRSVITDKKGNIYLTGSFDEHALKIDNHTLTNEGDSDIFLVKFYEPKN